MSYVITRVLVRKRQEGQTRGGRGDEGREVSEGDGMARCHPAKMGEGHEPRLQAAG